MDERWNHTCEPVSLKSTCLWPLCDQRHFRHTVYRLPLARIKAALVPLLDIHWCHHCSFAKMWVQRTAGASGYVLRAFGSSAVLPKDSTPPSTLYCVSLSDWNALQLRCSDLSEEWSSIMWLGRSLSHSLMTLESDVRKIAACMTIYHAILSTLPFQ